MSPSPEAIDTAYPLNKISREYSKTCIFSEYINLQILDKTRMSDPDTVNPNPANLLIAVASKGVD